jgi:hypothetical protein
MRPHNCAIFVHTIAMSPSNKIVRRGVEAKERSSQKFSRLAERFRNATDPKETKRLGGKLGRMIFGR